MDFVVDLVNSFATQHPYYFAAAWGVSGFFARAFIFTKENARKIIRGWFDRQRKVLKKLGKNDAEIKAIMQEEADFLLSAATEAKSEADAA